MTAYTRSQGANQTSAKAQPKSNAKTWPAPVSGPSLSIAPTRASAHPSPTVIEKTAHHGMRFGQAARRPSTTNGRTANPAIQIRVTTFFMGLLISICESRLKVTTNVRTDRGGRPWRPNWKLPQPARVRSSDFRGVVVIWLQGERMHEDSSVGCDANPSVVASGEGFRAVELKAAEIILSDPPRLRLLGSDQLGRCVLAEEL